MKWSLVRLGLIFMVIESETLQHTTSRKLRAEAVC